MRRGELRSYSALFSGIEEMLFSLDACCLFPWHVLAIIPLITGCSGIEALFHSLNSRGRAWCLLVDFLGVLAIHTLPGLWVQGLAPAYEFPKTSQVACECLISFITEIKSTVGQEHPVDGQHSGPSLRHLHAAGCWTGPRSHH